MLYLILDVVTVGTCNMDFILKVPSFVEPDGEMYIEKIKKIPGGSALNFAVNMSLNGFKSGIIAQIGNDQYGDLILKNLNQKNVDVTGLNQINAETGMAFISVNNNGKRSIYSFIGANEKLNLKEKDFDYIKSASLLHLTGTYWEIAHEAAKNANLLSFAPGTLLSSFGINKLDPVLSNTHVLFLNQKEVEILTGKKWDKGSKFLIEEKVPLLVVTKGDKGSSLYTKNEIIECSPSKTDVVDTTGAGDSFAAGFISKWINGHKMDVCLEYATECAGRCIGKLGGI